MIVTLERYIVVDHRTDDAKATAERRSSLRGIGGIECGCATTKTPLALELEGPTWITIYSRKLADTASI